MADSIVENPSAPPTHSLICAPLNNSFVIVTFLLGWGKDLEYLAMGYHKKLQQIGCQWEGIEICIVAAQSTPTSATPSATTSSVSKSTSV